MSTRRDSRTNEERKADDQRERDFHRKRAEAGLPELNYDVTVSLSFRDVTDAEANRLHELLENACITAADRAGFDRKKQEGEERLPSFSGSTYKIERNIHAPDRT